MKINNFSQFQTQNQTFSKQSFKGFRNVLNMELSNTPGYNLGSIWPNKTPTQETVDDFLSKVKVLGDITIFKREGAGENTKLIPTKVSLVGTPLVHPSRENPDFLYGLFEKGFENEQSIEGIDAKELGLIRLRPTDLQTLEKLNDAGENDRISTKVLQKAYGDNAMNVLYLTSHEGNKYKGIGSSLLDSAVAKSQQYGLKGKTCLYSCNYIPHIYSKPTVYSRIRKYSSPSNFYYKYGLRSAPCVNEEIKKALKAKEEAPEYFSMYLPFPKIKEISKRVEKSPILK